MNTEIVDVMGTMLLLAAGGGQPSKPFFSQQVVMASMHALTGMDSFQERQAFLWNTVRPGPCETFCRPSHDALHFTPNSTGRAPVLGTVAACQAGTACCTPCGGAMCKAMHAPACGQRQDC